ncbi:YceI family protein [Streptomyces sp. NPDC056529]|uniref:YceI family protein n=1 Tax=Streptomyces sp. NPDC056529 TaxID=3345855 RepID=UPI00369EBDA0
MFGRLREMVRANRTSEAGSLAELILPDHSGMLSCRVLDPFGTPLQYSDIVVTSAMGNRLATGQSDANGYFFASVEAGDHRIAVTCEGFSPNHFPVVVSKGEHTSTGDVVLEVSVPPQLPEPGHWKIDPTHTQIGFTVQHIGLARIHGRFNKFAGDLHVADRMEDSSLHVIIDAASIDTNVPLRDNHLRSSDFLNVEEFPDLEFYSERFVYRSSRRWNVIGALTLHGVTRSVTLETRYLGLGTGLEGEARAACRATAELHREDFTLTWQSMLARGIAVVGSSISIDMDIQVVPEC